MAFKLHSNLMSKIFLVDLPLCRVLLENERHYPWLYLIPRRESVSRLIDLNQEEQLQLISELDFVQNMMWKEFNPIQLNVAAIGNKTPQLHIHVIARYVDDPAWPQTVWDHAVREPYDEKAKDSLIAQLQNSLQAVSV